MQLDDLDIGDTIVHRDAEPKTVYTVTGIDVVGCTRFGPSVALDWDGRSDFLKLVPAHELDQWEFHVDVDEPR